MKIDLHTHTYFSDGSYSPADVVNMALERGVKYIAITDHDSICGVKEAMKAAEGKNIKVIPGIEITAKVKCSKDEIHVLGLYINPQNQSLKKFASLILKNKMNKTKEKIVLINKHLKENISIEDLKRKTKGIPGSAHIWMVLVDRGIAKNIQEAREIVTKITSISASNRNDKRITAEEAIKIIHQAGGLALLSHLSAYKKEKKFVSFEEQEKLMKELVSYGLDGVEIYIPSASNKEVKFGEQLARKYNLLLSVGSDFHDEKFIPDNKLGFLDIDKEKITLLS